MPYFVRTESGVEFGPVSSKELREAARSGTLARRDLVRPSGTVDWFRAERVRGLEFMQKVVVPDVVREEPTVVLEDTPEPPVNPPAAPVVRAPALGSHIEVLALRGFHVRFLADETVEGFITQSLVDALRVSIPAALLGRRGVFVLTSRRAFIVHAALARQSIECIYLDRIDRIGFGTRTAWRWFVLGVLAMIVGCLILGVPVLRVWWMSAPEAPLPVLEAAIALAAGAMLVILSRYRALELSVASGSIPFGKAALESDAISRIDELRERTIQRSRGVSESAHIS